MAIFTMAEDMPTTTLQVDEKTREALLRYASLLQARLGRKVTFDEAIRSLLQDSDKATAARRKLDDLFGRLAGEEGIWEELEEERKHDRERVERKG